MKLLIFSVLMMMSLVSRGQAIDENQIPQAVLTKFKSTYPDASKIQWDMEDGMYEVSFRSHNVNTSVVLSRDGTLVLTETPIEVSALPTAIHTYARTQLGNAAIKEATKIVNLMGRITYEAEINGSDYIFSSSGELIYKKASDDDDGEDDQ